MQQLTTEFELSTARKWKQLDIFLLQHPYAVREIKNQYPKNLSVSTKHIDLAGNEFCMALHQDLYGDMDSAKASFVRAWEYNPADIDIMQKAISFAEETEDEEMRYDFLVRLAVHAQYKKAECLAEYILENVRLDEVIAEPPFVKTGVSVSGLSHDPFSVPDALRFFHTDAGGRGPSQDI